MARAAAALLLVLVGCGEPEVDVAIPPRDPGQPVLDLAGILGEGHSDVRDSLHAHEGTDVVVLTVESEDASLGYVDRAGRALLDAWGADVALVAVAEPGHFERADEPRRRFFGVVAPDTRLVPRSVRERIVEEVVPPAAAENRWTDVFLAASAALREGLR